MVKESQKAKVERLEKELWQYKVLVSKLQNEIYEIQDKADNEKVNSATHTQIVNKVHNERGAGRKARFTDCEKETMRMYRIQGNSFRVLAEMFGCSVGTVHKIINENQ